ncbi:MAG: SdrD B-like domain-containing protein [Cytophagaceae bacterium]
MKFCRVSFLLLIIFILPVSNLYAQEERKVSLNIYPGITLFPLNERINDAGVPTNIYAGFAPAPTIGLGVNYKIGKKLYLSENIFAIFARKQNHKLNLYNFRTDLKYVLLKNKKFTPYIAAGLSFNLLSIARGTNTYTVDTDTTANAIGPGIKVYNVQYNDESMKLSTIPVYGPVAGLGFSYFIKRNLSITAEYSYNYNFANSLSIIKDNYPNNLSNLQYSTITFGITYRFIKPGRQLLASVKKDDWSGDQVADVLGSIQFKKPEKVKSKVYSIEIVSEYDSIPRTFQSDEDGKFYLPEVFAGNYDIYLPRESKKVLDAKVRLRYGNSNIALKDDMVELEMFEDEPSETIISRDGNFSVVLREGFQHEVHMTVVAMSVKGKLGPLAPDTSCADLTMQIRNERDSLVQIFKPGFDCNFSFEDLEPGKYKVIIKGEKNSAQSFTYKFDDPSPLLNRQGNSNAPDEPEENTNILSGNITDNNDYGVEGAQVLLLNSSGIAITNAFTAKDGSFKFNNVPPGKYKVAYKTPDGLDVNSKLEYTETDQSGAVVSESKFGSTFGKVEKDEKSNFKGKGKIDLKKNSIKPDAVQIYLIDNEKRVVETAKPDQEGNFSFKNLKKDAGYSIAVKSPVEINPQDFRYSFTESEQELKQLKTITKVKVFEDQKLIISPEETQNSSSEKVTEGGQNHVIYTPSKTEGKYLRYQPGHTYDMKGEEISLPGFGVQLAAYSLADNLDRFCKKLKTLGYNDIYIQVIQLENNRKIYRVIVGSLQTVEEATILLKKLQRSGFDGVLRKHK